jgi:hypothetical protein
VAVIGHEPVDRSWLPTDLTGKDVLCLASGGGPQGPILAAAGARVTVFDNLPRQIGGQLAAGFVLTGFAEAPHQSNASAQYMSHYFATRAVNPG